MSKQLIFDVTDANTILDSDSVGAYVRSSDGTLITSTTDGASERLDVKTELGKAESSSHVSGDIGSMSLGVRNDAGTALAADGEYIPLSMDATGALRVNATVNVDANSDYAEDSAHTSSDIGGFSLSVRMDDVDGVNTALLAGTEGDYQATFTNAKGEMHVRDNDAVDLLTTIDADTSAIAVDLAAIEVEQLAQGVTLDAILVDTSAISVDTGVIAGDTTSIDATLTALSKSEDAIHVSGDQGIMALAVRNDAGTSLVSADGDYASLQLNATGSLYAHITGSEELTVNDSALANTAIASSAETLAVANTAQNIVTSVLADRKYLFVRNEDNRKIYVGATGVTAASGFPLSPSSVMELRIGAAVDVEFVGSTGQTPEIRTLQAS